MVLRGLRQHWVANRRELGITGSESVALVERISAYMYTGNKTHIPRGLWTYLGVYDSLELFGWPFIDPLRIDFEKIPPSTQKVSWLETGSPPTLVLGHLKGIRFHFGQAVASRRAFQMSMLCSRIIDGPRGANLCVMDIFTNMFIPEMVEIVLGGLKNAHTSLTTTQTNNILDPDDFEERNIVDDQIALREAAMDSWKTAQFPFEQK